MEIRHLRLIKAIVEEGSLTRAMHLLHLTQSALSYQLKEAESQLGTLIFYRRNRKLILTPVGQKVYSSAKRILKEMEVTEAEIKKIVVGDSGTIRISTECYTTYHWLPAVIKKFKCTFPDVAIEIVFEATHNPLEKLLEGELDLAITSSQDHLEHIDFIKLFTDEMLAVVSPEHPWSTRDYIEAIDFESVTLIIHSLPLDTVSIFRSELTPKDISPRKLIVLPLTEAAIELVKANMGVIVLANWTLRPYLNSGIKTVKINPDGFFRKQFVARMKDREYPEFFDCFIQFLKEEIRLDVHTPTPG